MANPERGEVAIEIGGEDRILRFTHSALASMSARGLNYKSIYMRVQSLARKVAGRLQRGEEIAQEDLLEGDIQPHELQILLWGGLLHEDSKLSLEDAGALMDEVPGDDITEREEYLGRHIFEALTLAISKKAGRVVRKMFEKSEALKSATGMPLSQQLSGLASTPSNSGHSPPENSSQS